MDVPVILAALPGRWRYRLATAMAKEFFKAHFFPEQYTSRQRFAKSLEYYLSAAFFNTFPLPQREAGARQTLRYAGELVSDGFSVLIFPEGKRTDHGEIAPFRPGIGMMAARLAVPIVPVRLEGIDRVLLYPTIGIAWEHAALDAALALAYSRAYNRWIVDFCRTDPKRLYPVAHITLLNPEGAVEEVQRTRRDGCVGVYLSPDRSARRGKSLDHPDFERF